MSKETGIPATSTKADDPRVAPHNVYADLVALAEASATYAAFSHGVLQCLAQSFRSPYAALHIQRGSEVLQDDCHFSATDPEFWKASLQEFLTDVVGELTPCARVLKSKRGNTRVAFLSLPILDRSQQAVGAMAFVVAPVVESEVRGRLATLDAAARLIAVFFDDGFAKKLRENRELSSRPAAASASGASLARGASYATPEELAFSMTNELHTKLGCEQVALGLVIGRRVKLLSISGLDMVNVRSPSVMSMAASMEECLDAGEIIGYQRDGDDLTSDGATYHLHKQWHVMTKGDAVVSIPLKNGDQTIAVLSVRDRSDRPLSREKLEGLQRRAESYAPALVLTHRASRTLIQHGRDQLRTWRNSVFAPGWHGKKVAALAGMAALFGCTVLSVPYKVTVPCVVTADGARTMAAPMDGVLQAVEVEGGSHVRRGTVLCRFDHQRLDQELRRLDSEWRILEAEQDLAMAKGVPIEAKLAAAKQDLVDVQRASVRRQIELATVVAPFDGIVIAGDLRERVGSVVARGEELFAIAPEFRWRLDLHVAQSVAGSVRVGQAGTFVCHARPDVSQAFQVARFPAAAEVRDGRTVFVAEGSVSADQEWLRPGMEGVARIAVGRRRILWQLFHRPLDYLRLHFWL